MYENRENIFKKIWNVISVIAVGVLSFIGFKHISRRHDNGCVMGRVDDAVRRTEQGLSDTQNNTQQLIEHTERTNDTIKSIESNAEAGKHLTKQSTDVIEQVENRNNRIQSIVAELRRRDRESTENN